jgi:hypothetical protein
MGVAVESSALNSATARPPYTCGAHLKPHERLFISNYLFCWTNCFLGLKGRTAVAVRKGIPHTNADLPLLV